MRREIFERLTPQESRLYGRRFRCAAITVVIVGALLALVMYAFSPNRPRDYASDLDHFFYGSIGSDISGGLPLKVLQVLPRVFPDYLPDRPGAAGYARFGFIQQPGRPLPIGFSIRRQFIDLAALNCAGCHTGSVRQTAAAPPHTIPGMPANTLNLLAFFQFLFRCAGDDDRFDAKTLLTAMESEGIAGPLDGLIYQFVVPVMKDALLAQERKLRFLQDRDYTAFGPGRVSTFDTFKFDQFAYYYKAHGQRVAPDEIFGIVDFPSVWNQAPREGLKLHWDGNNTSVRERNFSAAIAAGARPEDMDLPRLYRIEAWLTTLKPPAWPFAVDARKTERGKAIYGRYCAACHDFDGSRMGQVIPLDQIGTDRSRLDSYTPFLLEAQKDYTSHVPWRFNHFSKTNGYANQPLDGIWARAPYLHNGSVPTMWDLLTPEDARPKAFTIGGDLYDPEKMGFRHEVLKKSASDGFETLTGDPYGGTAFVLDTGLRGNGNRGHSGPAYGTALGDADKRALIEYLKTR